MDEAVLNRRRLRMQTHSLLAIRFVTRHMRRRRFDEVLYQLGSEALSSIRITSGRNSLFCSTTVISPQRLVQGEC
jgi:hypothetical protein